VSDWIYRPLLWDYVDVNFNERFGDSDEEQMEEWSMDIEDSCAA